MAIIGGKLGYRILRCLAPGNPSPSNNINEGDSDTKLQQFFGENFFQAIKGKTVIDFGCGNGSQCVEMAQKGAARVIGIDIQEKLLACGKTKAEQLGVSDCCSFTTENSESELADIIISKDAFEHFSDPASVLQIMASRLKLNGYVLAAFGPTWLHPYGGHLFSVFPWSHLIFTEKSQIRWRSDFKTDGATRFSEVEGGLNQLTINRFEQIVRESPFDIDWLETVPIRGISLFKSKALREIASSIVRCKLILSGEK